ncbi:hypothetical protein SAMN02745671_01275 [Anaerovibrio lipolyticus DSM 3074]|uniref:Methylase-associated X1 domain-containing protein n=2 Tax=Anaerovibrio lipolyticus TaxID=82374 RepID=A0A0B2JUP0_9FIRM|nr:hypothetical protein [Anaerovibrio lipolyticus]KHM52065.1 hypothetical protein NZ47_06995 [Anaerovibrio lipolyticus]SHI65786.1 hypothetical protein SAMN02745671_01275 [Anaerovibrio lipolyticus DSM 3074]
MTSTRLTQKELHSLFLQDIGVYADAVMDNGRKPLRLHLKYPFNRDIKAYIFNCTAPPGGRSIDEFKVQLILDGQKRGERGRFDTSDIGTVLIVGYAAPFIDVLSGIWVLFELDKHMEFAYSANIQVYLRQMLPALEKNVYVCQKHNKEILVISQRQYLLDALIERFNIDLAVMLERAEHGINGT